ncbi:MAG: DUF2812 domain-containing protein [Clostridiaceae bacterium]
MEDKKTEFKFFSVMEWEKEEEYLRNQHKNGWEFEKVKGYGSYHFIKAEPRDMIYKLDYNQDSTDKNSGYIQMFNDCGWEYLQNYMGYSYFRKPASGYNEKQDEIFCDDESRLEMVKKIFIARMVPLLILFFVAILPQILLQSRFDNPVNKGLLIVFEVLLVIYLVVFGIFTAQFYQFYKKMKS